MSAYSDLLTQAIRSLINVTEERDIDSLFSGGKTTALTQTFAGLDDFELVAFIAIVPTGDVAGMRTPLSLAGPWSGRSQHP